MSTEILLGISGLAFSIVGIPITFALARRGRKRPHLHSVTDFEVLMSPNAGTTTEALSVAYGTRQVPRVSRTYVAMWNHQGDTIRATDMVERDRLRLELPPGDTVLQVQVLATSRTQCDIATCPSRDSSQASVEFEFLDAGDGAVLEVLHTGTEPATVKGTLKGVKMVHKGSATLTPSYLNSLETKRLARRVWDLLFKVSAATFVATTVVIGVTVILVAATLFHEPRLVDISKFDTDSLAGQAALRDAINSNGLRSLSSSWIFVGSFLAGLLVLVVYTGRLIRSPIPKSIIAEKYYKTRDSTS